MSQPKIYPGFNNLAQDAQRAFRATMDAMARPGTIEGTPVPLNAPAPLNATAAMLALTLCDFDSPIWLDESLYTSNEVTSFLSFHTSAPITKDKKEAQFAFFSNIDAVGDIGAFAQGTDEYPDRSTTLIIQVEALKNEGEIILEGPGIETTSTLRIAGATPEFWDLAQKNHKQFPRGVDFIFATPNELACLPRSTKINQIAEAL